jgi:hypothetical protein
VNILRAGKCCERLCGDLLAVHQRNCTLGKMETFTQLVGIWLVGMIHVGSSRSGSWYAAGVKPVCIFWLQVGCL